MAKKKLPLPNPRCPKGGVHNDLGRQYEKGGKLYTCCSKCGVAVAVDDMKD